MVKDDRETSEWWGSVLLKVGFSLSMYPRVLLVASEDVVWHPMDISKIVASETFTLFIIAKTGRPSNAVERSAPFPPHS